MAEIYYFDDAQKKRPNVPTSIDPTNTVGAKVIDLAKVRAALAHKLMEKMVYPEVNPCGITEILADFLDENTLFQTATSEKMAGLAPEVVEGMKYLVKTVAVTLLYAQQYPGVIEVTDNIGESPDREDLDSVISQILDGLNKGIQARLSSKPVLMPNTESDLTTIHISTGWYIANALNKPRTYARPAHKGLDSVDYLHGLQVIVDILSKLPNYQPGYELVYLLNKTLSAFKTNFKERDMYRAIVSIEEKVNDLLYKSQNSSYEIEFDLRLKKYVPTLKAYG